MTPSNINGHLIVSMPWVASGMQVRFQINTDLMGSHGSERGLSAGLLPETLSEHAFERIHQLSTVRD
jgi:hypothetical protein